MKTRPMKILFIALTLPLVTSCAIVDNILGMIALNALFESEALLTHVSLASGSVETGPFDKQPIYADEPAALTYGLDALIVPEAVSISQMGFTINIDFEVTFSEGTENFFFTEVMSLDENAEEGAEMGASGLVIYPVGTVSKPASFDDLGNWMNLERLSALKKEENRTFSMTVKGTSASKTKSRTFYFGLSGDAIEIPGGGDVDFDQDYLLVVEEPAITTTLEVTIPKANLTLGHEVPLQVAWFKLGDESTETGKLSIGVEILGDSSDDFEVISSEPQDNITITKKPTLVEWPNTIKLKSGKTLPSTDLVVRYSATVILD